MSPGAVPQPAVRATSTIFVTRDFLRTMYSLHGSTRACPPEIQRLKRKGPRAGPELGPDRMAPLLQKPNVMRQARPHRRFARSGSAGLGRAVRRLANGLVGGAAILLVIFHAQLLWTHVAAGRILDPDTAMRWAGGALLVAALLVLRRIGVSLLWSRQAALFWVLVAVLHGGLVVAPVQSQANGWADPSLLFIVPSATCAVLTIATGVWLSRSRRPAGSASAGPFQSLWLLAFPPSPCPIQISRACLAPRPPPL